MFRKSDDQKTKERSFDKKYDLDIAILRLHTRKANIATETLYKEQINIRREREKRTSKKLPKCLDNYDIALEEFQETAKTLMSIRECHEYKSLVKTISDLGEKLASLKQETDSIRNNLEELEQANTSLNVTVQEIIEIDKKRSFDKKYDLDVAILPLHIKKAKIAAETLYKEQINIRRKRKKPTSKKLPKCLDKYDIALEEFQGTSKTLMSITECHEYKTLVKTISDLGEKLESFKQEIDSMRNHYKELEQENSSLKVIVQDIIEIDKKPSMIDVKLSMLYENDWKRVFDALKGQMDESSIIRSLLSTLMEIYQECLRRTDKTSDIVIKPVQIHTEIEKQNVQLREREAKEVQGYVSMCMEIGWLCALQNPPCFLYAPNTQDKFDSDIFRYYEKKSCKYVDYVVWPALYIHKGGPLLRRGVAKGTDDHTKQQ